MQAISPAMLNVSQKNRVGVVRNMSAMAFCVKKHVCQGVLCKETCLPWRSV